MCGWELGSLEHDGAVLSSAFGAVVIHHEVRVDVALRVKLVAQHARRNVVALCARPTPSHSRTRGQADVKHAPRRNAPSGVTTSRFRRVSARGYTTAVTPRAPVGGYATSDTKSPGFRAGGPCSSCSWLSLTLTLASMPKNNRYV